MDKEKIKQFIISQRENGVPDDQIYSFLQEKGAIQQPQPPKKPLAEKVLDFTGGKEIAQGLGQAIALPGNAKVIEDTQKTQFDAQAQLLAKRKELKADGQDVSKIDALLAKQAEEIKQFGMGAEEVLNPNQLTEKQVIGDALQLATTAAGGYSAAPGLASGKLAVTGKLSNLASKTGIPSNIVAKATPEIISGVTKTPGILSGAGKGFISGAKTGAAFGGSTGISQGLQEDKTTEEILTQGLYGTLGGGLTGGVLGGLIGGISGGIQGRKLNQEIIRAQEESGLRPSLSTLIKEKSKTNPQFASVIKEAQKQGYNEKEINLLASLSKADKPIAEKMYQATIKAQSDPRQIVRAADILGENATGIVKQVQKQNSAAGKLVDTAAKALKGQSFDASSIEQKVLSSLDDAGITLSSDGNIDFSQSVFKNTPELQTQIERVLRTIPDGSDAYQAHIFKKSVDELVDYGTSGQGLSGKAESLLKGFRTYTDDALDAAFPQYNSANTEFKITREFIDQVKNIVGKKVDFSTKEGAQAFGQAFRSAFSNNKSRGQTLKLIEDLQLIAKQRGLKGAEQNLLDQALYVNILEDTFGSQAATGLASEVSKGVKTAKGVIEGIRNPISGVLNATADALEAAQNITPEAKKQVLETFLRTLSKK